MGCWIALGAALALCGCRAAAPIASSVRAPRDEIVVCGQRVSIGTPVVTWDEFPGYDASRKVLEARPKPGEVAREILCYQPGRVRRDAQGRDEVLLEPGSHDLARLQELVDQFVLHFDVCGVSRNCFRVLQERNLSVHFLLDVDGTLYQTLDLADQAWHATKANPRSIGVEIANLGAYAPGDDALLGRWYAVDADGPYLAPPAAVGDGGVRTRGFVARPARREKVAGEVQGQRLEQYDFTPEQYAALEKLAAGLCRVFPRLAPDAPRAADGRVTRAVLPDAEFEAFHGILGHYHVQANKTDPGPAFDWEPFLAAVRRELALARP